MVSATLIRREMPSLLRLAVPIVLGEVGWMAMNFVDIAMIGHAGATSLAAVSLGSAIFMVFAIVCEGMLFGADSLVSQEHGAGNIEECFRTLWAGAQLALPASLLAAVLVALSPGILNVIGVPAEVALKARYYLYAMAAGLPALMGFVAIRVFLQGMHRVRIVAFAMISANLVNFAGNWVLIYGHFHMPAMGATGSGLATSISRIYMMLVLLAYLVWRGRHQHWPLLLHAGELHWQRIRQIVKLGVPAATQIALEVGAFSASTLLAGRLGAVVVSAHQIALLMASLTFMVPLGIGQATSVRVGHAIGQRNGLAAAVSAWSGVTLSACFMSMMAVVLWTLPLPIVHIFTNDPGVAALAVRLLAIAAFFQFFDGVQVTSICALRGSGNTRIAMVTDAIGWWVIGLPLGAYLCFGMNWGVRGLWLGLCVGLISIACVLSFALRRRMIRLQRELPSFPIT